MAIVVLIPLAQLDSHKLVDGQKQYCEKQDINSQKRNKSEMGRELSQ